MTIELLFLVGLFAFFSYCFVYIGITMPASPSTEMGGEQWPQLLLGLLILLLAVNIIQVLRRRKEDSQPKIGKQMITSFLKSKLFVAFILVVTMALMLEYVGFMLTTCLFIASYSILLGERRPWRLAVNSIVITVVLYVIFFKGLSIMLPRGYGIFREFALWAEML